MKYAKIYVKIWQDEKFYNLEPLEKLAFLYLVSAPVNTGIGLFHLHPRYLAADLNISAKQSTLLLERLSEKGLISYDKENRLLLIHNYIKYNYNLNNENHVKAILDKLEDYKKHPFSQILKDYLVSLIKKETKKEDKEKPKGEKLSQKGALRYFEIFKNVIKEKRKINVPAGKNIEGQCEYVSKFLRMNASKDNRLLIFKRICEKYAEFPREKYLFGDVLRNIQALFKEVMKQEDKKRREMKKKNIEENQVKKIDIEKVKQYLKEIEKEEKEKLIREAKQGISSILNMIADPKVKENLTYAKIWEILEKRLKRG